MFAILNTVTCLAVWEILVNRSAVNKAGVRSNFDAIVKALHLLPRMTKVHQIYVVLSS